MIDIEHDMSFFDIEPSSPSEQAYWGSDREDSNAVDENETNEENERNVPEIEDREGEHSEYNPSEHEYSSE